MPTEFFERCDAIEECYEFMLAYAGQGLPSDEGSQSGRTVREFLQRAVERDDRPGRELRGRDSGART